MSKRKAFNFYHSYYDVAKEIPEKERLAYLWAILQRQFDGIEPTNLKGMAKLGYISQQHNIDSQVLGYQHKTGTELGGAVGGDKGGSAQGKGEVEGKGKGKGEVEYTAEEIGKCKPDRLPILLNWLEYKRERKENYKSIGLKTLVKKFNTFSGSSSDLESIVELAIMNNYSGIVWDRYKPKQVTISKNPIA